MVIARGREEKRIEGLIEDKKRLKSALENKVLCNERNVELLNSELQPLLEQIETKNNALVVTSSVLEENKLLLNSVIRTIERLEEKLIELKNEKMSPIEKKIRRIDTNKKFKSIFTFMSGVKK
jgi:hypothetical protein